jgi:urease accessory protein
VGTSAGPLAGDDLRLDVTVGPAAHLTVRSVAATLVHPGARPGGRASRLVIEVAVGAGGHLVWAPEPTVLIRGCDHETRVHVTLDDGATLVWRDEVVLGRHGEETGSLLARLRVDRAGRPLLRNDLAVGPRWPDSLGPAGTGPGTGAVGTCLIVGPGSVGAGGATGVAGARGEVLALADDACLVTVIAPRASAVTAALDGSEASARPAPAVSPS